ncbi:LytTR family DNA-binding domain-containing protein [Spirosoma endophyticum]|uniref:LytTr DNA-binding domain-containing protein n=1 Tax=Spirosoma endophyticum TaxID=662367 RepID=A0A1I2EQN9_9BACT|nr:LytTR family DNA-binding domain-containing protein [Spirosoma endophyticum]SFE95434.1 LytTr DNA-binding domain-containing protein [Spirosoma endophyticum]
MADLVDKHAIYMMKKLRLSPLKLTSTDDVLIVYISGYRSYSRLHLKVGETHLHPDPLVRYTERLPHFIRVHKHYLINPHFVESVTQIDATHEYVTMVWGDQLPIARRRIPQVRKAIHAALASRSVAIQP